MKYDFTQKDRVKVEIELKENDFNFTTLTKSGEFKSYTYPYSDIESLHFGFNESIRYLCKIVFSDSTILNVRSGSLQLQESGSFLKLFKDQDSQYASFIAHLFKQLREKNLEPKLTAGDSLKSLFIILVASFLVVGGVFALVFGKFGIVLMVVLGVGVLFNEFGKVQRKKSYTLKQPPFDFLP